MQKLQLTTEYRKMQLLQGARAKALFWIAGLPLLALAVAGALFFPADPIFLQTGGLSIRLESVLGWALLVLSLVLAWYANWKIGTRLGLAKQRELTHLENAPSLHDTL